MPRKRNLRMETYNKLINIGKSTKRYFKLKNRRFKRNNKRS